MGVRRGSAANGLVLACLRLLELRRVPAWRNNTGAATFGGAYVRFGAKGSADVLGLLPPSGRFLAVECKTGKGRLSPEQRAWLEAVRAAGGLALVVRDLRELEEALRLAGVA